jgi:hypothetical protein
MIATMTSIKIILRKLYYFTCFLSFLALCLMFMNCGGGGSQDNASISPSTRIIVNHDAAADFNSISETWINNAKSNLQIAYGHTSSWQPVNNRYGRHGR